MWKRLLSFAVLFWKQLFNGTVIRIDNSALLGSVLAIFLVPYPWLLCWLIAVIVHELSHLIALHMVGVPVNRICIGLGGAKIDTLPLTVREEVICAAAGPAGGFALAALCFKIPCLEYCALAQSIFNLLPIYPMDGGRIFKAIVIRCFGESIGNRVCRIAGILIPVIITIVIIGFLKTKYL